MESKDSARKFENLLKFRLLSRSADFSRWRVHLRLVFILFRFTNYSDPGENVTAVTYEISESHFHVQLCNPMDDTVHGILQARIWEWVAFPFPSPGDLPNTGI